MKAEICDDVKEECAKFGNVIALKVPRPVGGSWQASPGVGKIFVKFDTKEACTKALRALAGRKFADRTVVTTYFPEVGSPRYLSWRASANPCRQENFEVGAW